MPAPPGSKVCRICMINSELIPIAEDNAKEGVSTILEMLETLNLNIKKNDGLPQDICISCTKQLNSSFKFIETSKTSDKVFRNQHLSDQDFKYVLTEDFSAQVYLLQHNNDANFNETPDIKEEVSEESDDLMQPAWEEETYSQDQANGEPQDETYKIISMPNNQNEIEKKRFVCRTCKKVYPLTNAFNAHIKMHLENGDLMLPMVASTGQSTSTNGGADYECTHCGMCFHRKHFYILHSEKYHKDTQIPQSDQLFKCDKKPIEPHILQFHLNSTASMDEPIQIADNEIGVKNYVCRTCLMKFPLAFELNQHISLHMRKGDLIFPNASSLKQTKSSNGAKHECPLCGMCFHVPRFLKLHTEKYHQEKDIIRGLFKCAHCDCQFFCRKSLEGHLLKKHVEIKKKKIIKCPNCESQYSKKSGLRKHILREHTEKSVSVNQNEATTKQYTCKICDNKVYSISALTEHIEVHVNETDEKGTIKTKYECSQCGMCFNSPLSYTAHNLKSHPEVNVMELQHESNPKKIYDCAHCHLKFTTKPGAKRHLLHFHKTEPQKQINHLCKICSKTFEERRLLNRHLLEHLRKGEVDESINLTDLKWKEAARDCNLCDLKFKHRLLLQHHIEVAHKVNVNEFRITGDEFSKYSCTLCKRNFSTDLLLRQHMLNIHCKLVTWYCTHPNCDKQLFSEKTLLGHEFRVHNNMCCTICKKAFLSTDTFFRHMDVVHGKRRDYLCPLCGKSFTGRGSIRDHLESHNAERKTYDCQLCSNTYKNRIALYVHIKTKHEQRKPFVCDFEGCDAKYFVPSGLKKHKMKHTGEKPYKCDYCPIQFRAISHRENHHRTHTGEKPYKCTHENCDRAFAQKYDLTKHNTLHTGEKRHVCHCGEAFRLSSALKAHMKHHTN